MFISPSSPTFSTGATLFTLLSPLTTRFLVGLFARLPSSVPPPLVVEALIAEPGRVGILEGGGGMLLLLLLRLDEEGARTREPVPFAVREFVDVGGFRDMAQADQYLYVSR
jgi:hypothetical protein